MRLALYPTGMRVVIASAANRSLEKGSALDIICFVAEPFLRPVQGLPAMTHHKAEQNLTPPAREFVRRIPHVGFDILGTQSIPSH